MSGKIWYFQVRGAVDFPLDMLRYDQCWPVASEDVANIADREGMEMRRVTLCSLQRPTEARWKSFLWHVVEVYR